MEKEYAFDIKTTTLSITQKEKYELQLKRREQELLKDMQTMGEQGIDAMKSRVEQKIVCKLMDNEEEVAEQELLQAKGIALKELLQPGGPSKQVQ